MNGIAICTEGLTRDFARLRAVDDLSLRVPAGIIFGFLGPNGAGKTTTIRLLLGLLEPTAGRAEVLGHDPARQPDAVRERTGALLEYSGLYERLSAEENLDFYGRIWRLSAAERRERIRELLTHFDLWDRRKQTVGAWSRGMRQKLALARTLLHRPSLIFLDEPTAGLDPLAAATLHADLTSLAAREGVTVFLTTHNLVEAEQLCARVAVIRQGRLLACGPPDQLRARAGGHSAEVVGRGFTSEMLAGLRARPEVASAGLRDGALCIGLRGDVPVAPLVRLLVDGGAEIEEVRKGRASLEEVFLAMMEEAA
jgi:ABC-2 type transport system ATP-binding protein